MTDYERLNKLLDYLNLSANSLAKDLGLPSPQVFYDIKKERHGISKKLADLINGKYLNINTSWLLTGEGDMLKEEAEIEAVENSNSTKQNSEYKLVPVYNMDAKGGFGCNEEIDCSEYISGYIPFKDARSKDISLPITGSSMIPTYPPGSIVLLREIENWFEFLETGQIYVLVLTDGRRLIKELRRSEENKTHNFLCISHNPDYEPVELPKKLIYKVYLVIAMYHKTTM